MVYSSPFNPFFPYKLILTHLKKKPLGKYCEKRSNIAKCFTFFYNVFYAICIFKILEPIPTQ